MKIIRWTDETVPDVEFDDNGDIIVYEYKFGAGYKQGDMIQYLHGPGEGTLCYEVVDVFDPDDDEQYMGGQFVTIQLMA